MDSPITTDIKFRSLTVIQVDYAHQTRHLHEFVDVDLGGCVWVHSAGEELWRLGRMSVFLGNYRGSYLT